MILNPCFVDYAATNVAETFTQPVDYFPFPMSPVKKVPPSAVRDHLDQNVSMIIIGGGGIVGARTWSQLKAIVDHSRPNVPIVIWGMGINEHGRFDRNYSSVLSYLETHPNVLIGLRDHFYKTYVPCASCMRPEFDAHFTLQREIGFYVHHGYAMDVHYPTMSNHVEGDPVTYCGRVLHFLGTSDIVVTNTYHGAYWATLLNRKVIVAAPFSNKFFGFKHEPVIVRDIGSLSRVTKLARSYPNALEESRRANLCFYQQVLALQRALAAKSSPRV